MASYPFADLERRWQAFWDTHKTFQTDDTPNPEQPKFYVLDMFPYPSGSGLHVGHPEGYTATDIIARYKRMKGFNVLHPMGWDAFGLPAEQYAIDTGTHPRVTTEKNINRFREQLKALGFSYDWDREVNTTDPAYYKWTQWIFTKLYEKGLAYVDEVPVNWCPALGTVLANEEIVDGKSERGGHPVVRVPMRQWVLRITAYADRLLEDLDLVDWPKSTHEMQKNWIGRSEGAEITFAVDGHPEIALRVFTTRPDTLFGATYMVLAPEHTAVAHLTTDSQREAVNAYIAKTQTKSEFERTELQKSKTGVFTGAYALNPANDARIPIYIADYVLASYGTGAIMAVPGHDTRDFEFARMFNLPIVEVVEGGKKDDAGALVEAWEGDGLHVNSASDHVSLDGLGLTDAFETMVQWLEASGNGKRTVNYKLRDWIFSRQRYWGEPFPVLFTEGETKLVSAENLPLTLPDLEEFKPSGTIEGPLALATSWVNTVDPETGLPARRETNTMPQWAGSCWYYLRYIDPNNPDKLIDPDKERYWMPVDLYVGGAEHAVLHLLYSRFWHKVLYDLGVVSTPEPFKRLVHQGLILGEFEYTAFRTADGAFVSTDDVEDGPEGFSCAGVPVQSVRVDEGDVEKAGEGFVLKAQPSVRVNARAYKMSKSRGNVVNPDDVVKSYGADSLRLYEMFMGPLEQSKPWNTRGVEGVHRFLNRVWRLFVRDEDGALVLSDAAAERGQEKHLHKLIARVTEDIEGLRFNTAIAGMMEFVNAAYKWGGLPRDLAERFVLLLAPFAPHLAEELWQRLGHTESLAYAPWPTFDPEMLVADVIGVAVQVNGKLRATLEITPDLPKDEVLALAKANENVQRHLEGLTLRKEVYVPGRIVNFVAN